MTATRRLPHADAAWLHMDRPTNLMVITALVELDRPVDRDVIADLVAERLLARYPRFNQRVVEPALGAPRWEEVPVDLDRHVLAVDLGGPGSSLAVHVADQMALPLDHDHPLWQVQVVGGTALLVRMHHCIADGISLARVLLGLTDELAAGEVGIAPPTPERSPVTALADTTRATVERILRDVTHPQDTTRLAARAARASASAAKLILLPPDHRSLLKGPLSGRKAVAWTDPLDLVEIRDTGRAVGATVNDVLLAALAGGLHRYLVRRDGLVANLRVVVPVNLRPLDEPVPADLGNDFGLVFLSLPVGVADPARRLAETKRRMDAIKRSPDGPVSYALLSAFGLTPPRIERVLIDLFATKASGVVTNVPGPREPLHLGGARIERLLPWVPQSGAIGFGASILSYAGAVTIGVSVDVARVPDPEPLVEDVLAELGALHGLAR